MVKSIKIVVTSSDHSPGSTVHGKLLVTVQKPYKCHSIVVKLWGRAEVEWTEGGTFYSHFESYIHTEKAVWKLENSQTGHLPPGKHCFPFSFKLPPDLPSSFESACGVVKYELEAGALHSGLISSILKSRHAVQADIEVTEKKSRAEIVRLYGEPVTMNMTKRLFLKLGYVSVLVNLPGTGFSPGETIPVSVHISNQSSRHLRVDSCLWRKVTYTSSLGKTKEVLSPIVTLISSPILPRLSKSRDRHIKIPADVHVTIKNCSIISVEYVLAIRVIIPWSSNLELKIPIVIAESDPASVARPVILVPSQRGKGGGFIRSFHSIQWPH